MNIILAYDTSCYTTSMAAVSENKEIVFNSRRMLEVKHGDRGLRQSEAVFKHLQQINLVQKEIFDRLRDIDYKVVAVAASTKPRKSDDSYMPVFLVGARFAEQLANAFSIPFIKSSHQLGHIYAAKYDTSLFNSEFLGFHLSGGTTELLHVKCGDVSLIGQTLDITVGQLVDRIGVAMGLPFPAGKHLEKIALQSNGINVPIFSSTVKEGNCNLSGLENQALKSIDKYSFSDIAMGIYKAIARCCAKMIVFACKANDIYDILVFGGVASSDLFRNLLIKDVFKRCNHINIHFGQKKLSSDNAVGIALYALEEIKNGKQNY